MSPAIDYEEIARKHGGTVLTPRASAAADTTAGLPQGNASGIDVVPPWLLAGGAVAGGVPLAYGGAKLLGQGLGKLPPLARRAARFVAHRFGGPVAGGAMDLAEGLHQGATAAQPSGIGPLGSVVGMVPERSLPPIEPLRPPIPGNFGGQPLAADMPPAGPPGLHLVPSGAEPVPTRPISIIEGGKQILPGSRAPVPTTEPRYTGGRGAGPSAFAKRAKDLGAVSRGESVTAAGPSAQPGAPSKLAAALEQSMQNEAVPRGAHPVSFGKNGNVIGAIGDEARVAGRAARSVEELGKLAAKIAAKVPRSARLAVFQTVKSASKFVGESDAALGGPAMAFMTRFFPTSTMQDIMNTHFTVDPQTGKIVKRHTTVGA